MYDGGVKVQIDDAAARGVTAGNCRRSGEAAEVQVVVLWRKKQNSRGIPYPYE